MAAKSVKLEPMADRMVVRPIQTEEVTKGGIVLPDTAKEKPQEGEVLAVGPGRMSDDGKRIPMDVYRSGAEPSVKNRIPDSIWYVKTFRGIS